MTICGERDNLSSPIIGSMQKETVKNRPPAKNLEGRRLQRLEASEPRLGAASDSPPPQTNLTHGRLNERRTSNAP